MFIVVNINYKTFRNYKKMPSCDFNNFANCTCSDCNREREIWKEKIEKQKELIINECNVETWKEKIEKQKEEQEIKRNDFLNKQNELFREFNESINNIELVNWSAPALSVPIKIIDSHRNYIYDSNINELGVNKKFISMKLMDVQKIKGRWFINKNKVKLFYDLKIYFLLFSFIKS